MICNCWTDVSIATETSEEEQFWLSPLSPLSFFQNTHRQMKTIEAKKSASIFRFAISNLRTPKNYLHLTVPQL